MHTESTDLSTRYPSPGAKLAEALAKAQSEIKAPVKTRHVDFTHNGQRTKYSYADLADVIESIRTPLSKNGLAIIHKLEFSESGYGLKTILVHSSGEFVDTWYPLPDPSKQAIRAQAFGSALTYARRYSLSSIVGIASEEDDDGQTAAETEPPQKKPIPNLATKPTPKPVTQEPPDDFDQFMDQEPEYQGGDVHRELVDYVKARQIPVEDVKKYIRLYCGGVEKRSEDMTIEELQKVLKHIKTVRR